MKEDYIRNYYYVVLYGRIAHKENKEKIYIFKNTEDLKRYIKENNFKLGDIKKNESNYIYDSEGERSCLFVENSVIGTNLVGHRIREINVVSSDYLEVLKDIYNKCKEKDYDVVLNLI